MALRHPQLCVFYLLTSLTPVWYSFEFLRWERHYDSVTSEILCDNQFSKDAEILLCFVDRASWYDPVNNQLGAQFFTYVYFYSLHVSGKHASIIRRIIVSMRQLVYVTLCR